MKISLKRKVWAALVAALAVSAGASAQGTDTAYVPFRVNVAATVKAKQGTDSVSMTVKPNIPDTLKVLIKTTQVWSGGGTRGRFNAPVIANSRGSVTLRLPAQAYQNAEIALYSVNGRLVTRRVADASAAVDGVSRRNVAAGVYTLSVKGAGGGAFTARLAHSGGNLNIKTEFVAESPSPAPRLAKSAEDGGYTITVKAEAAGYSGAEYALNPAKGRNNLLQDIILRPVGAGPSDSPAPVFKDVTVHDPSIFMVNDNSAADKYRIIGSFLGSAKTGDLMSWTLEQSGGNDYPDNLKYIPKNNTNASVQTAAQQKADVMRGAENDFNYFASDIHKMPNGKFYHYYNMTASWKCSAIGVAIANSVDGDYITQGLFVRSAKAGNDKAPNGTATWNIASHPNCIDAQAFFDKTGGNFYMVYGSWSGGIFIYEIDVNTGLPKNNSAMNAESDGYGRKLLKGNHFSIEAPYIIYSPDSDYYYLFLSYGGLAAAEGYNMRTFRSRSPDGPYEDAQGTRASNLTANNWRASGVKIMGGYHFAQAAGESALANRIGRDGFLAPGHNSAYFDAATGKYFLIHHTRFAGRGEEHQVRAREMFVNEDGWLAAAPFRYDAGTIRTFNAGQLAGRWKILSHERDINTTAHTSELYTFNENGGITGAAAGTWALGADGKTAHITLGGKLYKGVFLRNYDEYHSAWVYAFTALSSDGLALWGAAN